MTDHVTQERLEELERRFRADRRKRGPKVADRHWLEDPLRRWASGLEGVGWPDGDGSPPGGGAPGGEGLPDGAAIPPEPVPEDDDGEAKPIPSPLGDDAVAMLAVGMRDSLSVRDALILSLVSDEPCPPATLLDMAATPKERDTREMMTGMVAESFENAAHTPDWDRCERGLAMFDDLIASVPSPWQVQPFAAMAYILWWAGSGIAVRYALAALTLDEGCSLAAIVFSMLDKGIRPAWQGGRIRRTGGAGDGEGGTEADIDD
ncbi:DUF4192 family protein [Bifidobacterium samirii]|uniref:DUF4192 domain-containing protein n=1 Tax=Bifidobacterium samirii TaxID=2306974 RepID=A0A430FET4_9BIFI|nr:DUF4192 family protein [Bifidobacterium samirii]RSX51346.1 hypothetical protein D2E24_1909 [Bifidobacterium samirii]